jgi:hypothetical protein
MASKNALWKSSAAMPVGVIMPARPDFFGAGEAALVPPLPPNKPIKCAMLSANKA